VSTDITLLTSMGEHPEPSSISGAQVTRLSVGGDPDAAAIVEAVIADYHRVTGRPPVTNEQLAGLVTHKVTLLRVGENLLGARAIVASPGTIFKGSRLGLLPKGKRRHGFAISADRILDVEAGFAGVEVLRQRVAAVRATLPQLRELTLQRLARLPTHGRDCTLAVFGTWRLPQTTAPGAIWLLHSYLPGDDIAEGVLLVRSAAGVSEHGSVLGRELLRIGGEIVDAPTISLDEALGLVDADYAMVLARLTRSRS
jgi:hypothetical protein